MTMAVGVTLSIFIAGLIYHAGQMSMRLMKLEEWRGEMRADVATLRAEMRDGLASVERAIRDLRH